MKKKVERQLKLIDHLAKSTADKNTLLKLKGRIDILLNLELITRSKWEQIRVSLLTYYSFLSTVQSSSF